MPLSPVGVKFADGTFVIWEMVISLVTDCMPASSLWLTPSVPSPCLPFVAFALERGSFRGYYYYYCRVE